MTKVIAEKRSYGSGETENVGIDYTDHLDTGETLSGSLTVVEQTSPTELTLASKQINTAATKEILGRTVAISNAVLFTVSGGSSTGGTNEDGFYTIRITVTSSESRVIERDLIVQVI